MRITRLLLLSLFFAVLPAAADLMPLNIPPGPDGETIGYGTAVQLPGGNRWYFFNDFTHPYFLFNVQTAGGSWLYPQSQRTIGLPAVTLGTVLAYGVQPNTYTNPADGNSYLAVLYYTEQTGADISAGIAGRICLSYSNDGITWTSPITAVIAGSGKTWSPCFTAGPNNSTYTEAVGVYHHSAAEMHVFWVEGNVNYAQQNAARTLTYYATTTPAAPYLLNYVGEITNQGLYSPTLPGNASENFMVNLDISTVPTLGAVVISRAYSYPNDLINGTIPCPPNAPSPCPRGVAQFPNRVQAYCMNTGGDDRKTLYGTWSLIFDLGTGQGWSSQQTTTCGPTPLNNPLLQLNVAQAFNTISQVKNADGTLWLPAPLTADFMVMPQLSACGVSISGATQLYQANLSVCQSSSGGN